MISFAINSHSNWRKEFARFETELSKHKIKVTDCAPGSSEVLISVQTSKITENEIVVELAQKWFGAAYNGQL